MSHLGPLPLVRTRRAFLDQCLGDWKDDRLCEELFMPRKENHLLTQFATHWMDERNPEAHDDSPESLERQVVENEEFLKDKD